MYKPVDESKTEILLLTIYFYLHNNNYYATFVICVTNKI